MYGHTIDTNAAFISETITAAGAQVTDDVAAGTYAAVNMQFSLVVLGRLGVHV